MVFHFCLSWALDVCSNCFGELDPENLQAAAASVPSSSEFLVYWSQVGVLPHSRKC